MALDGTKIHANASRHSALSYEHASKIEVQLQAEVADLTAKAEAIALNNVRGEWSLVTMAWNIKRCSSWWAQIEAE